VISSLEGYPPKSNQYIPFGKPMALSHWAVNKEWRDVSKGWLHRLQFLSDIGNLLANFWAVGKTFIGTI